MEIESEKGQVIIVLVLAFIALLAMAALAADGGQLYAERRSAQAAADNAALASGYAICQGADPVAAGTNAAAVNDYDNNGTTNTVVVNHPPAAGPHMGDNEYTEVRINSTRETFFAQFIGINELPVSSRAVSRCRKSYEYAVLALTTRNDIHGLQVVGNGNLIVNGGGVMSDSTHPTQSFYDDGSGNIVAEVIHASGGVSCDGVCDPAPVGGMPYVPDPLASVPAPAVQPQPAQSTPASATCTTAGGHPGLAPDFNGSTSVTLNPGMYCYIRGDSGVHYTLRPGIYYIDGQNLGGYGVEVKGNSSLSGSGVMIYMSPNAGRFYMYGNANVTLAACKSTDAGAWCVGSLSVYSGMLFYADRSYTRSVNMIGNAQWNAVGTIYAAGSAIDLSGNAAVTNLSSMVVADTIKLGGDSDVMVNYDPGLNIQPPLTVSLVE